MELVKYLTEAVATELDAPLSEVYSSSRKKEAVWTRHIMWLIYEGIATQKERGAFYPINGKPRDHATVWHGVINIQNVFLTMPHLKEIYTRYKEIADEKFAEEREKNSV